MLRSHQALGGSKGGRVSAHVFPSASSPATALLSSFAVFGPAFLARPAGSPVSGQVADRKGATVLPATSLTVLSVIAAFALTRRAAQRPQRSSSPMSLSVEAGS